MAGCSPWSYTGISQQVFQSLQTHGRQHGFTIPHSPSGSFTIQTAGMKVRFRYEWKPNSGSLRLICTAKPLIINCSTIKSIADRIVIQSGGKPA